MNSNYSTLMPLRSWKQNVCHNNPETSVQVQLYRNLCHTMNKVARYTDNKNQSATIKVDSENDDRICKWAILLN